MEEANTWRETWNARDRGKRTAKYEQEPNWELGKHKCYYIFLFYLRH